jgi:hypothetical protein
VLGRDADLAAEETIVDEQVGARFAGGTVVLNVGEVLLKSLLLAAISLLPLSSACTFAFDCVSGDGTEVSDVSAHRHSDDAAALEIVWQREAETIADRGLRDRFRRTFHGQICSQDPDLLAKLQELVVAKEPLLRSETLFFLKYFGVESASKAWQSALLDPVPRVRLAGLAAIAYLQDRREESRVLKLAQADPDPSVREYAGKVLRSLRKPSQ